MKKVMLTSLILLLMLIGLIGCSGSTTEDATTKESPTEETAKNENDANESNATVPVEEVNEAITYKQAPMLDAMNLSPIEERLPEEPKLTNEMPPELLDYEIGTYGGTMRFATARVGWDPDVFVGNNEPLLNTPGILGEEVTGNILKGYEVTSDQKAFTFFMRKGLRWSDGEPVTVEDIRFTVEDILFNEEITPAFPNWLRSGGKVTGEPFTFEIIDEFTFKLIFDQPYGGLPMRLAIQGWRGYTDLLKPAHFLKPFHTTFTPLKEMEPMIKEKGFQPGEWVNLFNEIDVTNWELTNIQSIGFPVLYPWIQVNQTTSTMEFERNPYYFKIDSVGNQLPYIDKLVSYLVADVEMLTMKTLAGEIDYVRESAVMAKMPLYKENEKNGFKALLAYSHLTTTDFFLNLTHEDPVWREVVRDVRFRKALTLALNRDEMIDAIFVGHAEPGEIIDPTFNLAEANALLDEMGMEIGPEGFRLGPDGKKFTIPFEVAPVAPDFIPMTELIVELWKALNLDVTMKSMDSTLQGTRNAANELKATMAWTHTPLWYMADWGQGFWAPLWNRWYATGGKEGEEPPSDVKNFYDLIDQVSIASPDDARKAIDNVKDEMAKNYWYFVPVEHIKQPLIINDKLGNVSEKGFTIATNFGAEEYFFKP